ncbi:MAG: RsmB/NOP family class I SAM-dependent RNA methyltransferase, partial [Saprospiraceae bacterium]|nr:RsmB/NOP family class I SAM-dependent RNA methyltransferase [Saprospiraceae bacterium]
MEKGELPIDFIHQMGNIIDETELSEFISSVTSTASVTGIRFNPLKASGLNESGKPVPWTQRGFTLENRPNFTLDPSFHAGAYYVQDPSSMFVEWVAKKLLATTKKPFILDLAAAPGGKSTILAEIASEKNGFLLANEVIKSRVPILKQNLAKWGYANVFVSSFEVPVFSSLPPLFDLILLDAPCSGEGLFRKDVKARDEWSLEHVNHCASRQKRILSPIPALLKEGGYLIYSTCTYNTQENDDQIAWLCQTFSLEIVPMEVPPQWGIINTEKGGFQCFPHRVNGEGFYLAVLQKIGSKERNSLTEQEKRNVKVPRK